LDTARSEPGLPPGQSGFSLGQWPLAVVAIAAGVGLALVGLHHFRWGTLTIGFAALGGAILRGLLPTRRAGLLVVRTRAIDVVTMVLLGGGLVVLAVVTKT
jgi:hypothetical protein